jgi:hypothetical protein
MMAAEEHNDKALRDVKAVLHGLQRIGAHPPQAAANLPRDAVVANKRPAQGKRLAALALAMLAAGTVIVLAGDLFLKYWPSPPPSTPAETARGEVSSAVSAVTVAERAGAGVSTPSQPVQAVPSVPQAGPVNERAPSPAIATVPASSPAVNVPANRAITNAHELLDGGHVVAARKILEQPDLATTQEGAWLLARSYDPNYLTTIQSPDASADPRQAEEWYRRWRDIAARDGVAMDDLHLKRIIDSMR